MTCLPTKNAAGPCSVGGHAFEGELHVVGEVYGRDSRGGSLTRTGFFCKDHCPVHTQVAMEWKEPAKTITGEQEVLF